MFEWLKPKSQGMDMDAADVFARLEAGAIALVDVREPAEFRSERIPGAVNMPLSQFDPARLPAGKPVVLHCLSGGRSRQALGRCAGGPAQVIGHVAGGIGAWKRQGLPTTR